MDFKVGDIVQFKNNCQVRYIVTKIGSLSGKPTWLGISPSGSTNGGTINGSWDFSNYKVIGHYPIERIFDYIQNIEIGEITNGTKE